MNTDRLLHPLFEVFWHETFKDKNKDRQKATEEKMLTSTALLVLVTIKLRQALPRNYEALFSNL